MPSLNTRHRSSSVGIHHQHLIELVLVPLSSPLRPHPLFRIKAIRHTNLMPECLVQEDIVGVRFIKDKDAIIVHITCNMLPSFDITKPIMFLALKVHHFSCVEHLACIFRVGVGITLEYSTRRSLLLCQCSQVPQCQ